ncbi:histidine kinase dimerization/phospho-acceptor domain-containing protein [Desulfospira joergensenii]|uniref:histidine kinase dimerization/phospho-acceptor domain-containing protein n=1 Tax=Desulfospira joergensenii TaxID=53329 RepID=UPI00047FD6C4|nr:histidine kinase dimerization/phospho-acceptor domain-containing protein [Desulfospira joergensenii]
MPKTFQVTDSGIHTSESLLKVIDALPISIAVINKNRTILLANEATSTFLGKDKSHILGQVSGKAFGCIHHDDAPEGCGFGSDCSKCILRQTVLDTEILQKPHHMVETSMIFKEFGERHLKIFTLPILLDKERVVLLSLEDMTEAKEHERTLVEKEKLSAVMKTLGAVCHEINQPLMIVQGLTEIMMQDLPEGHGQTENLMKIKEQVERMGSITKKLMTITKYRTKPYLKGEIIDIDSSSSRP